MTTKMKTTLNPEVEETPDDFGFELPHFTEAEAGQAWLDSLPREEAEVDERLKKRLTVTMNLHQLMVDGFDYLAKRMGLKIERIEGYPGVWSGSVSQKYRWTFHFEEHSEISERVCVHRVIGAHEDVYRKP
jgi:hypothetical protein